MIRMIFDEWQKQLCATGTGLSDEQMEACARLTTVLLCGEQSAIRVFALEVERGRAPAEALAALQGIERDERLHERALLAFSEQLPRPDDLHALKRRAQRFFAGLGRTDDLAQRFDRIAQLDSAVCKIMWHIEKSSIDKVSQLRRLATGIKNDEARHVSVSRQYARLLPTGTATDCADPVAISTGLAEMLLPLGDSFEKIGVDSDRLFTHIRNPSRP